MRRQTVNDIDALFRELSMTPGPSAITRRRALRFGWLPPLAWTNIDDPDERPEQGSVESSLSVDVVAVRRRASGDRGVQLNLAERYALYRVLYDRGLLDAEIARVSGFNSETVGRWRQRMGLPSNVANEKRHAS
jgi:hypothetical protein